MRSSTAETLTTRSPRELGERLFAALSAEEQEARLVLAVFELPDKPAHQQPDMPSPERLKQAAIARLLVERSIEQSTQQIIEEWRADLPPLPEFEDN